jgi:hypothetical protein
MDYSDVPTPLIPSSDRYIGWGQDNIKSYVRLNQNWKAHLVNNVDSILYHWADYHHMSLTRFSGVKGPQWNIFNPTAHDAQSNPQAQWQPNWDTPSSLQDPDAMNRPIDLVIACRQCEGAQCYGGCDWAQGCMHVRERLQVDPHFNFSVILESYPQYTALRTFLSSPNVMMNHQRVHLVETIHFALSLWFPGFNDHGINEIFDHMVAYSTDLIRNSFTHMDGANPNEGYFNPDKRLCNMLLFQVHIRSFANAHIMDTQDDSQMRLVRQINFFLWITIFKAVLSLHRQTTQGTGPLGSMSRLGNEYGGVMEGQPWHRLVCCTIRDTLMVAVVNEQHNRYELMATAWKTTYSMIRTIRKLAGQSELPLDWTMEKAAAWGEKMWRDLRAGGYTYVNWVRLTRDNGGYIKKASTSALEDMSVEWAHFPRVPVADAYQTSLPASTKEKREINGDSAAQVRCTTLELELCTAYRKAAANSRKQAAAAQAVAQTFALQARNHANASRDDYLAEARMSDYITDEKTAHSELAFELEQCGKLRDFDGSLLEGAALENRKHQIRYKSMNARMKYFKRAYIRATKRVSTASGRAVFAEAMMQTALLGENHSINDAFPSFASFHSVCDLNWPTANSGSETE